MKRIHKSAKSLAFLNSGQALIITAGTIAVLVIASFDLQSGLTIGEFVGLNVIMMQLFLPLNFWEQFIERLDSR